MHDDLVNAIQVARMARDACLAGSISHNQANAIARSNATIIGAHTLDLRVRIFEAGHAEPQRGADDRRSTREAKKKRGG